MKLLLSEHEILRNCVETIKKVGFDEIQLKVSQKGIKALMPSRDMVAVVNLNLLPSMFEHYEVEKEEKIGLNLSGLLGILNRADKESILEIDSTDMKVKIGIRNEVKRDFYLPIIDIKTDEKSPIEKLTEMKAKVEVRKKTLEKLLKDAELVSGSEGSISFEARRDSFKVSAKADMSKTETEIKKEDKALYKLEAEQDSKSEYPIEYMKPILTHKGTDTVVIEFATDYPAKIGFRYLDKASLNFYLAPKVSE